YPNNGTDTGNAHRGFGLWCVASDFFSSIGVHIPCTSNCLDATALRSCIRAIFGGSMALRAKSWRQNFAVCPSSMPPLRSRQSHASETIARPKFLQNIDATRPLQPSPNSLILLRRISPEGALAAVQECPLSSRPGDSALDLLRSDAHSCR